MINIEDIKKMITLGNLDYNQLIEGTYNTPIDIAIDNIDIDLLLHMINQGLDLNLDYDPPLIHRIANNLFTYDNKNDSRTDDYIKMVDILLNEGADPSMINENGRTPLEIIPSLAGNDSSHIKRSIKLSEVLFGAGAALPTTSEPLFKFFYNIINSYEKDETILNYYLDKCEDISILNDYNQTLIQYLHTYEEAVKALISKSELDINNQDNGGNTLLSSLCDVPYPKHQLIKAILDIGADPNIVNSKGDSPLHLSKDPGVISMLIDYGGDINMQDCYGRTPMHRCSLYIDCLLQLMQGYPDPHIQDDSGELQLHKLYREGNLDDTSDILSLTNSYLDMGLDIDTTDSKGMTILHYLCLSKSNIDAKVKLFRELIELGIDLFASSNNNNTCLSIISIRGDIPMLEVLLNHLSNNTDTLELSLQNSIAYAIEYNNKELVDYLLSSYDFSLSFTNKKGFSPLHLACQNKNYDILKRLLDEDIDIDSTNNDLKTPLHIAVMNNDTRIIYLLLEWGADIDITDKDDVSLLHVVSNNGHLNLVKLLIEKGADIDKADKLGRTPLHYSIGSKKINVVKYLISEGADIDFCDNRGRTPLMLAISESVKMVYMLLIESGADINTSNNDGEYPIHMATKKDLDCLVQNLVAYGADIDAININGQTSLHIASSRGLYSTVKTLIDHQCSIDIDDKWGDTALDIASNLGHSNIVELLLN